jgi:hypothetical protein
MIGYFLTDVTILTFTNRKKNSVVPCVITEIQVVTKQY